MLRVRIDPRSVEGLSAETALMATKALNTNGLILVSSTLLPGGIWSVRLTDPERPDTKPETINSIRNRLQSLAPILGIDLVGAVIDGGDGFVRCPYCRLVMAVEGSWYKCFCTSQEGVWL
jgi:hypothetical protein